MDNTKKSPTILSLCTGYGGLEKGISAAIGKCTVLAHVEIEAFAITNLVNKMETGQMDPVPIWTDLKTFDARPFRGCVDILTGGYPCQPFSTSGKRKGSADPRHLWPYIRTIILHANPGQVFFENVEGHLTKGIAEVLEDLEGMGYTPEVGIFSAAEVGAPHQRKRVFILANSNERSGETRAKRTRRTKGSDFDRCGERSELEHSEIRNEGLPVREIKEKSKSGNSMFNRWPARRGARQFEWEEPRVLVDSRPERQEVKELQTEGIEQPNNAGRITREAEPKLGRTIDGARNRVDRIRLLGNGVVRQAAEKAYIVLSEKLLKAK